MGFEDLTDIEIVIGICDTIFIIISLIIGLKLILKYFSNKQISLITVGLSLIFFSITWTGGALSFILFVSFNIILDRSIFLIISNAFTPIALICWVYSFCNLLYPKLIKLLIPIYIIICVIYEIFLFIFIFTAPDVIGTFYGNFYYRPKLFPLVFYTFGLITLLFTGVIFTIESFNTNDKKLRWRNKFLLIAFISLVISIALEGLLPYSVIELIILRIISISSAFEYYLGFFLPERIAKFLIKED